ncbi:MAG TPA: hypothetical protein ENJ05_07275 [Thiotrichales bacterium]|nr:hypothetical protein [Thiotrichales bacterium]
MKHMNPSRRCGMWLVLGLLLAIPGGQGVLAAPDEDVARERKVLTSKLRMLDNILFRSQRAKRVEASGDARALALLEDARSAYRQARADFDNGDLEAARQASRQSLEAVTRAFALIVDSEGLNTRAREQYRELLENIRVYEKALMDTARRKGINPGELLDQDAVEKGIREAQARADTGDYANALTTLRKVSNRVEAALSRARARETVTYALEFATPLDEYRYEYERNRSYVSLAQVLLSTAPPSMHRRIPLIKRLIEKSERQVKEAEMLREAGNVEQAIKTIELANKTIVQALRMGGLAL